MGRTREEDLTHDCIVVSVAFSIIVGIASLLYKLGEWERPASVLFWSVVMIGIAFVVGYGVGETVGIYIISETEDKKNWKYWLKILIYVIPINLLLFFLLGAFHNQTD